MAKRLSVISVNPDRLELSILPRATQRAFLFLKEWHGLKSTGWYLAGGTALALQKGHRQSVDLDFFSEKNKDPQIDSIERALFRTGHWSTTLRETDTLYGKLLDAKVSFISYPFFQTSQARLGCGNVEMLTSQDIAVMKIIAISQRGRKRDFVDLYWYCQHCERLEDVIDRAIRQYPGQEKCAV
jgi:predicted nucleotidyltransferase component of viral defense system